MTTAQRRKLFALVGHLWDKSIGEYIIYAVMIARYGKASTKGLTQSEIDELIVWLEGLDDG